MNVMKSSIMLAVLLIGTFHVYCQEEKFVYCQIVGTGNLLGTKVTITVDYGDPQRWANPNWIKNDEGKVQKFNSMIDALNYFGSQGWEFVQAYAITVGNQNVYHYILKRPTTEEYKAKVEPKKVTPNRDDDPLYN